MPDTFTHSNPLWNNQQIARRYVAASIHEYRSDVQTALNDIVRGLTRLHEATGRTDFLEETVAGLCDHISNITGQMYADLEDAGLVADADNAEIETDELDALLAKVRGRK